MHRLLPEKFIDMFILPSSLCLLPIDSPELSLAPSNSYITQHADGWTITKQDLVLLTETRPMLRISAIGVDRTCVHLVYHQLVQS